jgi:hypothetical protein
MAILSSCLTAGITIWDVEAACVPAGQTCDMVLIGIDVPERS